MPVSPGLVVMVIVLSAPSWGGFLDLEDAGGHTMGAAYEEPIQDPVGTVSPEATSNPPPQQCRVEVNNPSISPLPLSDIERLDPEGDTVDLSPAAATASTLPGGN